VSAAVMRRLIRADGSTQELEPGRSMAELSKLIGADGIDTVTLRHLGYPMHVMLVDDLGHDKRLPVNAEATKLYLANCVPHAKHQIRGDVVVVLDDDFAAPAKGVPLDPNCAWPFPARARGVES
jgi:hypothetical protein